MMLRSASMLVICMLASAASLSAQGLRDELEDLFRFGGTACGEILCLPGLAQSEHGRHFIPAAAAGGGALIDFLTQSIAVNVTRAPVPSSSGAALFRFEAGLPVRVSSSAGPIYAERGETLGRGRLLVGASATLMRFSSIRGIPMDNLLFNFAHEDVDPEGLGDPNFENDIIQVRARLDVDLFVATAYFTYGIIDGLDVGLIVPFVQIGASGTSVATVIPIGSGTRTPVHRFAGSDTVPILVAESAVDGSAGGIGDVSARMKIGFGTGPGGGCGRAEENQAVCAGVLGEVRFPTGDEDDLLGSGDYTIRALGNLSARLGRFSPHINAGYLLRVAENQTDAVLATVGFDQLVGGRATAAVDLITEWEVGEGLGLPGDITYTEPFARTAQSTIIPQRRDDIVSASFGLKLAASDATTILLNALLPLSDGGMTPNAVWAVGVQLNF